jgi:peptidoglycan/LPS O-acetylase OafA/YrhL
MISERSLFLHYLRISSALIVCLGHTKEFLFVPMDESADLLEMLIRLFLGLGTSAVLVFFFLSGFLVGGKEIRRLITQELIFRTYIFDRLTRLWLVLIPALLLTFALNLFTCRNSNISLFCTADPRLASHADIPPLLSQEIFDLFSNVFFLQPFIGLPWGGNGPLWSISYEFWYYIVFFSLLRLINSFVKREISFSLVPQVLILFLASKILNFDWLILGIIWLSGACAAYFLGTDLITIRTERFRKSVPLKFTLLTFFLILPALVVLKVLPNWIAFPVLIIVLTFCIATMRTDVQSGIKKRLQDLIAKGSEFSFSLYVVHFPLIALLTSHLTPVNRWNMSGVGLLVLLGLTFVSIVSAYAFALVTEFKLAQFRLGVKSFARKHRL